jgi:glycosyltransferase involved in cell wall biosynthesis
MARPLPRAATPFEVPPRLSKNAVSRALLTVLWPVRRLATLSLAFVALAVLLVLVRVERRRPREPMPRIFWGVNPLISIRTHSEAVRRLGYPTASVVSHVYAINRREDFDFQVDELLARAPVAGRLPRFLRDRLAGYWTFGWALRRFDIFAFYSDSTILRWTPLKYREMQLLQLAGKKVLLLAYGADVQIASRARNLLFKHAFSMDYPSYARGERRTLRDLEYSSRYADHIVSGVDWVDYMPWWDRLTAGHFAIDVEQWKPKPRSPREPAHPVVVLHAPNHRELKGTRFLVCACEELADEGLPIELRVVERQPNETIRDLIQEADIVADQFVVGWYAQFALEGMSMAKPVLCYLRPDLVELYTLYSFAGECPIVNTSPLEIKEKLRELATDPERRAELGRRGRRYVSDHHSLEALGTMFDEIFTALWPRQEAS